MTRVIVTSAGLISLCSALLLLASCSSQEADVDLCTSPVISVLRIPVECDDHGDWIVEAFERGGAVLTSATYRRYDSTDVEQWPVHRSAAELTFADPIVGLDDVSSAYVRLTDGRIEYARLELDTGTTSLKTVREKFDSTANALRQMFGEPIWSDVGAGTMSLSGLDLPDGDRPFFSMALCDWMSSNARWRDSVNVLYDGAANRRDDEASAICWKWKDSSGLWVVLCEIDRTGVVYTEEYPHSLPVYRVLVSMRSMPQLSEAWRSREKEYSGWVRYGSDVIPQHGLMLCDQVADSGSIYDTYTGQLSLRGLLKDSARALMYYTYTYGTTQLRYALDTSRYEYNSCENAGQIGGQLFVKFRGILVDSSQTKLGEPIMYISRLIDIRYPEEYECE